MKEILLSTHGGDRATAYTMSSKIVKLPAGHLCTWIDSERQNQWALVDIGNGRVLRSGLLGTPCVDNHCGAALALAADGVHAVTGGHFSPLEHYRMDAEAAEGWQHLATLDVPGTYPSLLADAQGRLHVTYRAAGERWTLDYARFDGQWSQAETLVVGEKAGYIYWTNGLALGPDGALHLALGNTRVLADGSLFYGASTIMSPDGGVSWLDDQGQSLATPATVSAIPMMVDELAADRVHTVAAQQACAAPGPTNAGYYQIHLSNPVVDPRGVLHVVLHNALTGTADLMSLAGGNWRALPLTAAAVSEMPGYRVHMQSSLTLAPDGKLLAAVMIEPTEGLVWGPPGTQIVILEVDLSAGTITHTLLPQAAPSYAQWLPALQRPGEGLPNQMPTLLYTKGSNAGGFDNNTNALETEVYHCALG